MAYKLVRKSSETPNITNRDDARMVRYAYGNYDGVVKGFGEELSITVDGSTATIHGGRMVLNGWEVDVDSNGVSFEALPGSTQYYCVVLTVNLANESAEFTIVSNSGVYPDVPVGDDLSQYPNGFRRIITHRLSSVDGVFSYHERIVPLIPYLLDFENRLNSLGFKQGDISVYLIDAEGHKHEILWLENPSGNPPYSLIKQGKIALFSLLLARDINFKLPNLSGIYPGGFAPTTLRIEFPKEFTSRSSGMKIAYSYYNLDSLSNFVYFTTIDRDENNRTHIDLKYYYDMKRYYIYNVGWQIE